MTSSRRKTAEMGAGPGQSVLNDDDIALQGALVMALTALRFATEPETFPVFRRWAVSRITSLPGKTGGLVDAADAAHVAQWLGRLDRLALAGAATMIEQAIETARGAARGG